MLNSTYNGFINILKPSGPSSADIVSRVKRMANGAKCGHLGTLDPLAAGVLPVAIGKATKLFNRLALKRKKYRACFKFGIETETGDTEGKVTQRGIVPGIKDIENVLPLFTGKINQMPHTYSAVKIGGKKACDLARQGEKPQLNSRQIEIYNIEIINSLSKDEYTFDIECSAGTYIRSLCRDIAKKINTVGCMTMLIRLFSGSFDITRSVTLDELENIDKVLLPVTYPLSDLRSAFADNSFYDKLSNGLAVRYDGDDEKEVLVFCRDIFFGIGNIKNNMLKVHLNLRQYD